MRYKDYLNWVDSEKIYSNLPIKLVEKINFFYKHVRKNYEKLVLISKNPIVSCTIETNDYLEEFPTVYPWKWQCYWSKTYCVYDGYFEDLPYGWNPTHRIQGIMSVYDLQQETQNFPLVRDHVNLKCTPSQDINSWIFLNKRKDRKVDLTEQYFGHKDIYTINTHILLKMLLLKRKLFSRILIHSKP